MKYLDILDLSLTLIAWLNDVGSRWCSYRVIIIVYGNLLLLRNL